MPSEAARRFLRRDETLLGAVLFGFLILLSLQVTAPDGQILFKRVVYQIVAPVVRLGDFLYRGAARLGHDYAAFRAVVRENEVLRARAEALEWERLESDFMRRDYAELRALTGYREAAALPTLAARVVARDLRDPYRMLVVNRGRAHGVEAGMALVAPEGVVGRVVATSLRTAQVQLITDARGALAGIHLPSGEQVLLTGQGQPFLKALYFSVETDISEGDWIVTAGLEGVYPQGLRVGRVERVAEEDARRVAWVRPSAPMTKLVSALVVLDKGAEPAEAPGGDGPEGEGKKP
jgi:rod shape-determining protein MreC